jgi:uncharacterized protein
MRGLHVRGFLIAGLVLVGAQGPAITSNAQAASFSCAAAKTFVEHAICNDAGLSGQDDLVAALYKAERGQPGPQDTILSEQRGWLAQRNKCTTLPCLTDLYANRIAELRRDAALGERLKREASQTKVFVQDAGGQAHYEMTLKKFLEVYPDGDQYYSAPFFKCVDQACSKITIVYHQSSPAGPFTDYIHAFYSNQGLVIREIMNQDDGDTQLTKTAGDELLKHFAELDSSPAEDAAPAAASTPRPAVSNRVPRNMFVYNKKHELTMVTGVLALAQTYTDAGFTFKSSCKDEGCTQYLYHFKKGDRDDFYIVQPLNEANDVVCMEIVATDGDLTAGEQIVTYVAKLQAVGRR